jgi:transcriptional regulator with XRE-family HTH domain
VTGGEPDRRELGQRLAGLRRAAGYTQVQLAARTGYSRSTVSNAEIGHPDVARVFWASCDKALRTGRALTLAFDEARAAERRPPGAQPQTGPGAGTGAFQRARQRISGDMAGAALAGYRDLGWAVLPGDGGLELVTGDTLDALEVPRAAGMLAMSLWLYSRGRADEVRQLPALPDPDRALAVITAGDWCYFLAAAGGCPWTGHQPGAASGGGDGAVIRWHAGGGRIPAPPSRLPAGDRAAWAHLPSRPVRLAPAIALLGLLATAAATARHGPPGLTLPGGIRVIPAARP